MYRSSTLLALPMLAALAVGAPSQGAPQNDDIVVEFDAGGTPVADFLKVAQAVLGKQIYYADQDVAGVTIEAVGRTVIPRAKFRGFVESSLFSRGFLLTELGDGLMLSNPNLGRSAKPGYLKSQATLVPQDKLAEYRGRYAIITTVMQSEGMHVQEAVNMLQTYFTDPMTESVRAAGDNIVMTGYPHTLIAVQRILKEFASRADAAEAESESRVAALEKRVAELEAQVAALSKAK